MISKSEFSLKIVCKNGEIFYYCQNDNGSWAEVTTPMSKLSRNEFKRTSIIERGSEIIDVIDDEYGLDGFTIHIVFIGDDKNYEALKAAAKRKSDKFYIDFKKKEKIAVIGDIGAGKTTLIEALNGSAGLTRVSNQNGYTIYNSDAENAVFYEAGINALRIDEESENTIKELNRQGVSEFVFCINTLKGKVYPGELEAIKYIKESNPQAKIVVVFTQYIYADDSMAGEFSRMLGEVKVFKVLAKDFVLRDKQRIPADGVEKLAGYLFGENAYD